MSSKWGIRENLISRTIAGGRNYRQQQAHPNAHHPYPDHLSVLIGRYHQRRREEQQQQPIPSSSLVFSVLVEGDPDEYAQARAFARAVRLFVPRWRVFVPVSTAPVVIPTLMSPTPLQPPAPPPLSLTPATPAFVSQSFIKSYHSIDFSIVKEEPIEL